MHKGQLAQLPVGEGRRAERRVVNLAASLREPGATLTDVEVHDLSADGFMVHTDMPLEVGASVWLKLAGMEAQKSTVIWVKDGKAGLQFAVPLHRGTIEQLTVTGRPQPRRNHFGPQRSAR